MRTRLRFLQLPPHQIHLREPADKPEPMAKPGREPARSVHWGM